MTEANLVVRFWERVHHRLREKAGWGSDKAWRAINRYRSAAEGLRLGDLVYHQQPDDLADGIVKGRFDRSSPKLDVIPHRSRPRREGFPGHGS